MMRLFAVMGTFEAFGTLFFAPAACHTTFVRKNKLVLVRTEK
jgi:hypothetical protein